MVSQVAIVGTTAAVTGLAFCWRSRSGKNTRA
jgi:hypothetical protein